MITLCMCMVISGYCRCKVRNQRLMFCGVLFLVASLPLSPALISASEPEDQHLLPSDVLEAWTKPGLFDFASVEGESQETRTYKGEVSRARNVFFAARNDQGACVLFEREQDGEDFNSSVFGRNDTYSFRIVRDSPDGKWQLRSLDLVGGKLSAEVDRRLGHTYYDAAESEAFVGFESLVELAKSHSDRFTLTEVAGTPNRFEFSFSVSEDETVNSRMGLPLSAISGFVEVSLKEPFLPKRIEWVNKSDPDVSNVSVSSPSGTGDLSMAEEMSGDGWTLETTTELKRRTKVGDNDVFFLSYYGLEEPAFQKQSSLNWPAIFLFAGGALLVAFMIARRSTFFQKS